MFEPIKNPYIVGNPIKGTKMFFGREDDFAYVKTKFTASKDGGLMVLCGARRSGKTSILFQILDGRLGEDFVPVLIDMQSMAIRNDEDFLGKLTGLICDAFPEAEKSDESAAKSKTPFTIFEEFIAGLEPKLNDRKLLLAFDEYELIETQIDGGVLTEQLLHLLAGLIEHRQLYVLFTGSDHLEARDKPYWDVFLSKALYRRVSFLSYGDTMRLIKEPVDGLVEYADGVPERIAAATAGQPFYTQVVCQSVVDHLNDVSKRDVDDDDLATVLEYVIENPLPQMIFHWNAYAPAEKLVLAIIADLARGGALNINAAAIHGFAVEEKIGYAFDEQALNKLLESLFHGDMLTKAAEGEIYSYKMGLWQRWVGRMHSTWQVLDEIEKEQVDLAGSGLIKLEKKHSRKGVLIPLVGILAAVVLAFFFRGQIMSRFEGEVQVQMPGGETISAADAARVTFESNPPAQVRLNGRPIGVTPMTSAVRPGAAEVRFELNGYGTFVDSVRFARNETTTVAHDLVASVGYVNVDSDPPGAAIIVDSKTLQKTTPTKLTFRVLERPTIELRLAGYNPYTIGRLTIVEDSTINTIAKLSLRRGTLTVRSNPSDAMVLVDRELMEQPTPISISGLEYGEHELILKLNGYEEHRQPFSIPWPKDDMMVNLTPLKPGYIIFKIIPYATSILVNKQDISVVAQNFKISHAPGEVEIEMLGPSGSPFVKKYIVASGDSVVVQHTFGD